MRDEYTETMVWTLVSTLVVTNVEVQTRKLPFAVLGSVPSPHCDPDTAQYWVAAQQKLDPHGTGQFCGTGSARASAKARGRGFATACRVTSPSENNDRLASCDNRIARRACEDRCDRRNRGPIVQARLPSEVVNC